MRVSTARYSLLVTLIIALTAATRPAAQEAPRDTVEWLQTNIATLSRYADAQGRTFYSAVSFESDCSGITTLHAISRGHEFVVPVPFDLRYGSGKFYFLNGTDLLEASLSSLRFVGGPIAGATPGSSDDRLPPVFDVSLRPGVVQIAEREVGTSGVTDASGNPVAPIPIGTLDGSRNDPTLLPWFYAALADVDAATVESDTGGGQAPQQTLSEASAQNAIEFALPDEPTALRVAQAFSALEKSCLASGGSDR